MTATMDVERPAAMMDEGRPAPKMVAVERPILQSILSSGYDADVEILAEQSEADRRPFVSTLCIRDMSLVERTLFLCCTEDSLATRVLDFPLDLKVKLVKLVMDMECSLAHGHLWLRTGCGFKVTVSSKVARLTRDAELMQLFQDHRDKLAAEGAGLKRYYGTGELGSSPAEAELVERRRAVTREDLMELRKYQNPPRCVTVVMKGLCVIYGMPLHNAVVLIHQLTQWHLDHIDHRAITQSQLHDLKEIASDPVISDAVARRTSACIAHLAGVVRACYKAAHDLHTTRYNHPAVARLHRAELLFKFMCPPEKVDPKPATPRSAPRSRPSQRCTERPSSTKKARSDTRTPSKRTPSQRTPTRSPSKRTPTTRTPSSRFQQRRARDSEGSPSRAAERRPTRAELELEARIRELIHLLHSKEALRNSCQKTFRVADVDSSGSLGWHEMKAVTTAVFSEFTHPPSEDDLGHAFAHFDSNSDHTISLAEFMPIVVNVARERLHRLQAQLGDMQESEQAKYEAAMKKRSNTAGPISSVYVSPYRQRRPLSSSFEPALPSSVSEGTDEISIPDLRTARTNVCACLAKGGMKELLSYRSPPPSACLVIDAACALVEEHQQQRGGSHSASGGGDVSPGKARARGGMDVGRARQQRLQRLSSHFHAACSDMEPSDVTHDTLDELQSALSHPDIVPRCSYSNATIVSIFAWLCALYLAAREDAAGDTLSTQTATQTLAPTKELAFEAEEQARPLRRRAMPRAESNDGRVFTLGLEVDVRGHRGRVRSLGSTNWDEDGQCLWVGVELYDKVGKNNGTAKGETFFHCAEKHGVIVRARDVAIVEAKPKPSPPVVAAPPSSNRERDRQRARRANSHAEEPRGRESVPSDQAETETTVKDAKVAHLPVGAAVLVAVLGERRLCRGTVNFVGPVGFARGILYGIVLDEPVGIASGTVAGKQYFSCAPFHAFFATRDLIEGEEDLFALQRLENRLSEIISTDQPLVAETDRGVLAVVERWEAVLADRDMTLAPSCADAFAYADADSSERLEAGEVPVAAQAVLANLNEFADVDDLASAVAVHFNAPSRGGEEQALSLEEFSALVTDFIRREVARLRHILNEEELVKTEAAIESLSQLSADKDRLETVVGAAFARGIHSTGGHGPLSFSDPREHAPHHPGDGALSRKMAKKAAGRLILSCAQVDMSKEFFRKAWMAVTRSGHESASIGYSDFRRLVDALLKNELHRQQEALQGLREKATSRDLISTIKDLQKILREEETIKASCLKEFTRVDRNEDQRVALDVLARVAAAFLPKMKRALAPGTIMHFMRLADVEQSGTLTRSAYPDAVLRLIRGEIARLKARLGAAQRTVNRHVATSNRHRRSSVSGHAATVAPAPSKQAAVMPRIDSEANSDAADGDGRSQHSHNQAANPRSAQGSRKKHKVRVRRRRRIKEAE